jgi:hypothetical protein
VAAPKDGGPFSLVRRKIVKKHRHVGPGKSQTFGGAAMTSGEPPPPEVKGLEWDKTGPFCPDKTVKFTATTSPPNTPVTWEIDTVGGQFKTVEGDESDPNTLEVHGVSGRTIVVKASLPSSSKKSDPVIWKTADLQINVPPGPNNGSYVITDEPRMPAITATALFQGGSGTVTEWDVSVNFLANDCPPFGPHNLKTTFQFSQAGGNEITTDAFGDVIRGGSIIFSAKGTVNGCTVSGYGGHGLAGTNPKRTDIQAELENELQDQPELKYPLQRIACKESGQRQFNAAPDGGTAYCPLFGPGGKVGIMQIAKPTADEVWNWRKNVAKGVEKFKAIVKAAEAYPSKVEGTDEFKNLVSDYNAKRQAQGLDPLEQIVVPAFTKGDFKEDLGQLELDAIRGYDGWGKEIEADRFGLGLHEFRVAVDLIDGQEVLRVNANEETLQGTAVWEPVPVTDRHMGRPNYVNEVLAFWFDCTPAAVPCNLTGVSPATRTLFVGSQPFRFTAEGTGSLAKVQWKADGGSPESGKGATFTTKWSETGQKTVTASCGGTTKTATVNVFDLEIQVNNTKSTKDDIVQVMSNHPRHVFIVPCRIRVKDPRPTAPVRIDLLDPTYRLQFSLPADTNVGNLLTVDLPTDGNWVPFEIAGAAASEKKGDAQIKAFYSSEAVAKKKRDGVHF